MKRKIVRDSLHVAVLAALTLTADSQAASEYQDAVIAQGPIGYWRLNETATPTTGVATNYGSLGAAANATYYNSPLLQQTGPLAVAGDTGAAFDGFGQKAEVPYSDALNLDDAFTAEMWINVDNGYNSRARTPLAFEGWDETAHTLQGFTFYMTVQNKFRFQVNPNGPNLVNGPVTVNGKWYHVVAVREAGGAHTYLYVDGASVASSTSTIFATNSTSGKLRIGAGYNMNPFGHLFFPGKLAHVALYKTALSAGQVLAHYQNGTNSTSASGSYSNLVVSDGAVGYWPLNESMLPTQPVAANLGTSAAVLDGNYFYGSAPGVTGPRPATFVGFESTNAATDLDAAQGGVVRLPALNLNTNTATFLCWVKRNGEQLPQNTGLLFTRYGGTVTPGGSDNGGLSLGNFNSLRYGWNLPNSTTFFTYNSSLFLPDAYWSFVALVITPTNATLYCDQGDGNLSSEVNTVNHSAMAWGGPSYIGNDSALSTSSPFFATNHCFTGSIDEVAVFNKALNPGQIQALFSLAKSAVSGPVLGSDPPGGEYYIVREETTTLTLSPAAAGTPPLSYQWYKDSVEIPGATNSVYEKTNLALGDLGTYSVKVTNLYSSVTSQGVYVQVDPATAPTIVQAPSDQVHYAGSTAMFTVVVSGTQPYTYQWKFNGGNIPDATNNSLVIPNLTTGDQGAYSVAVSNAVSFATGGPANLTVLTPTPGSYAAEIVNLQPVAYWPLNEASGSLLAYDYVGDHNATNSGVTSGVVGPRPPTAPGLDSGNFAAQYDGVTSTTEGPIVVVTGVDQFTLMGWFKPNGVQNQTGGTALFGQRNSIYCGYADEQTIGVYAANGGSAQFRSSLANDGAWNYLVATGNGTNISVYLNGQLVAMGGTPLASGAKYGSSAVGFRIGHGVFTGAFNNIFNGDIDEVTFFDRALSGEEISQLVGLATGGQVKLNLAAALDLLVKDSKPSGTPHDGVNDGAEWLTSDTDANTTTRNGVMQFIGTNSTKISLPEDADFNNSSGTIAFWLRTAGNIDPGNVWDAALIHHQGQDQVNGDVITVQNGGLVAWKPTAANGFAVLGGGAWRTSTTFVNDDLWHHVAYVYQTGNGQHVLVYVDGVLNSDFASGTVWDFPAEPITIGFSPHYNVNNPNHLFSLNFKPFDGKMDDIRFYSGALLTDAEIASIYAGTEGGTPVQASSLAGRYNFDTAPEAALSLTWPLGTLESADSIEGPWTQIAGAKSPYAVNAKAGGNRFFRTRL